MTRPGPRIRWNRYDLAQEYPEVIRLIRAAVDQSSIKAICPHKE